MFSYEHLASFCATIEQGSYSQAAKKLNKDRTTVREQVKALEDSYAITLFEIQGKKAVPSKEGQALYQQASLLVRNTELLNTRMMDSYKTTYTSLDIYHDILVPNSLILHIEDYMKQAFPNITINWLHRNRQEMIEAVSNTKHSLAIMQNRMISSVESAYSYIHLGTDKLAVYCRPQHPISQQASLCIEDLQLEKQYVSENHIHTLPALFSVSVNQHIVSNNDVLLNLVQQDGWAFISKNLASPLVESGALVELEVSEISSSLKVGISFYYPLSMNDAPELEGLKSTLREYAKHHMS
ncbi:LysR family transcriptional regulator [Vibrio sp. D404a]|uniref:LysR family transcriptional regulator n=1 Tax=unclassified Vibrio TaxID=2614977 RepID=UPI0025528061|nr:MULTISPECIES: LysR family transcriptional regulator [unclassified Vibrio]MDK9736521.1 LysR family transcriptional regulator [Vibrio sp. D404a]MDK9796830.1 LysR family transcriptional regulator [Vibrio sp. D449a]